MKENFPNLAKEIDFQEVQVAQRGPKKLDPRQYTPKHIKLHYPMSGGFNAAPQVLPRMKKKTTKT